MDLEQLQKEAEKDLKINNEQLDIESLKTPELYGKYLQIYTRWNLLSKQVESEYKKLLRHKWEYYSGKADPKVYQEKPFDLKILKQDIPTYLEGDEDLITAKHKVDYHNSMCDFAENVMKMLNNRGFQIKNAIDWKRFLEGSF
tara:strand:+ start:1253 stop:1681 length:429 start_codon:yes stop_codon:yes gene_type:complete